MSILKAELYDLDQKFNLTSDQFIEFLTETQPDLDIEDNMLLSHMTKWLSEDDLKRCLGDYIIDNNLEEEFKNWFEEKVKGCER